MSCVARRSRAWLVAVAVTAALVACSSGGGRDSKRAAKNFRKSDFALTFAYPGDLREATLTSVARSSGKPEARAVLALDEDNFVALSKYRLKRAVPRGALSPAVVEEMDGIVRDLTGKPVAGKAVQVAGLPAVRYDKVELSEPRSGQSRLVYIFDGATEYQLNCQLTLVQRDKLTKACDQVVATLKRS